MILVPIESAYVTSYKSIIVKLVLSCTVSEVRRLVCWKLQIFLPLLFGAPAPYVPLDVPDIVNQEENRVMGLSSSEDRMIVAWVILTQCQRVTDGRTDGFTIAGTALYMASYADVL